MQKHKQRLLVTAAATIIAAALGTAAGYQLGRAIALHYAQVGLDSYGWRFLTEVMRARNEAQAQLAAMNGSPYAFCSDDQIAWFRKLIFQSEYLKDGGGMRDGRIYCSATLGRQEPPIETLPPDFTRDDGTKVYRNLSQLKIRHHADVAIQLGDFFVVYNSFEVRFLEMTSMHFTISDRDIPSGKVRRLFGELPAAGESILTRDGWVRTRDSLFVTHCGRPYSPCLTTYVSNREVLQSHRGELAAYTVLTGLCGALFGIAVCLLCFHRWSIEQQLRRAIERDDLHVEYQPIVDLATRQVVGAEALVRWHDEEGIVASPEVFIRIAEERGFVGAITQLVVSHALRDFKSIMLSQSGFRVFVNITASDLSDTQFLLMLEKALADAGVSPQSLGIEITESCTARQQTAKDAIHRLREKGHTVSIDDFGTGYSSLAYLHDLAADIIKIDRTFTWAVGTESATVSILPQILAMAAALKLQLIVEGIETEEQASYFSATGQSLLAQGWLFGRPVNIEQFRRDLAAKAK